MRSGLVSSKHLKNIKDTFERCMESVGNGPMVNSLNAIFNQARVAASQYLKRQQSRKCSKSNKTLSKLLNICPVYICKLWVSTEFAPGKRLFCSTFTISSQAIQYHTFSTQFLGTGGTSMASNSSISFFPVIASMFWTLMYRGVR